MTREDYMRQALSLAREAAAAGEVPVGCVIADEDGQIIDHVTRTCLETFGLTPDAAGMREAFLTHRCFAIADTGFMSELVEGEAALELWEKQGM